MVFKVIPVFGCLETPCYPFYERFLTIIKEPKPVRTSDIGSGIIVILRLSITHTWVHDSPTATGNPGHGMPISIDHAGFVKSHVVPSHQFFVYSARLNFT